MAGAAGDFSTAKGRVSGLSNVGTNEPTIRGRVSTVNGGGCEVGAAAEGQFAIKNRVSAFGVVSTFAGGVSVNGRISPLNLACLCTMGLSV